MTTILSGRERKCPSSKTDRAKPIELPPLAGLVGYAVCGWVFSQPMGERTIDRLPTRNQHLGLATAFDELTDVI